MIGLASKNAILIVEFTNCARGLSITKAALEVVQRAPVTTDDCAWFWVLALVVGEGELKH